MLTPEERLSQIRSIIRRVETKMDSPACDQLPLLRSAFVEIIQAAGPQCSGSRGVKSHGRRDSGKET